MNKLIAEYIIATKQAEDMRAEAHRIEKEALTAAEKAEFPANVRPATASDIVEGAVIWYKSEYDNYYWKIVFGVYHPEDNWKAYGANDGSRYGLHNAFIEL